MTKYNTTNINKRGSIPVSEEDKSDEAAAAGAD
jgi:hypothetical protein